VPLRIAFDLDGVFADMEGALTREAEAVFGQSMTRRLMEGGGAAAPPSGTSVNGEKAAATASEDPAPAEAHLRQALALATRLGMRPAIARCHLGLGEVARRLGRPAQARAALTTASGMFRELGMETYGARSEAELRVVADGTPGC